ncbi:MAG: magnesium/cobalt transporter CorA [Chlorobiaceae bacterium]|nr:magnesium/cobalt transporter CorA [Chlorobiaceae bacterium]NTV61128.1 magnesium/cobalt transporter CorA [Chlorobiaceae bacterium]
MKKTGGQTKKRQASASKPAGMKKVMRGMTKTVGKDPGTLLHTGERKTGEPRITVFGYDESREFHMTAGTLAECAGLKGKYRVLWINIDGLHDVSVIEEAGRIFGIHSLTLEDILQTGQRSKIEDFETCLFLLLRTPEYVEGTGELLDEQLSMVVGEDYVLTFQEKPGDMFDAVRERIKNQGTGLRKRGADYLAYMLVDAIVDSYFIILESIETRIDQLDQELFSASGKDTFQSIYTLKKDLIQLRKAERPMREIINRISVDRYKVIDEEIAGPFFRDVYDNVILINETIETYRDIVLGMYDTWLAIVNNRMNEIMKVLTTIATIFMPLSFLAGVYGMNFSIIPGAGTPWGFYGMVGVMTVIFIGMVLYFRTRKWF